jgi:hypothetical protein
MIVENIHEKPLAMFMSGKFKSLIWMCLDQIKNVIESGAQYRQS